MLPCRSIPGYQFLQRGQEEKALFVDVDLCTECDYSITFADSQKLQRLHRNLVKCKGILDCCLDVALRCNAHWQELYSQGMPDSEQAPTNTGSFLPRMKAHKRGIEAMQEQAQGIATLVGG